MAAIEISSDEQAFLEYVQGGGQVELTDWLPEDYRAKLIKFIEMHGNSELMGVLPEREWILRAPTLQRKLALTAKVQDEVGHAQLIYRVVEDLGKPREQCLADLVDGKAKFHNVFHYPTKTWGDVGVIAWLVDAAAIISEKARQQFLDGYVPQIWELGLTVPDPKLRRRDDGVWEYTEPDWAELKHVVTGHGPCTAERLAFRTRFLEQEQWVRDAVLADGRRLDGARKGVEVPASPAPERG